MPMEDLNECRIVAEFLSRLVEREYPGTQVRIFCFAPKGERQEETAAPPMV